MAPSSRTKRRGRARRVESGAWSARDRSRRRHTARDCGQPAVRPFAFQRPSRFFGYITSSPAPIGALGDLLASAVNQNCGVVDPRRPWRPKSKRRPCGGLPSSLDFRAEAGGCSSAAATWRISCACWRRERPKQAGMCARPASAAVIRGWCCTRRLKHTHGFRRPRTFSDSGTDAIRWIAVDGHQRMNTAELRRQIEVGSCARRSAVPRGRDGRFGQHGCGRSAAGNRSDLPGARSLVPCRRRIWSAGGRRSRCAVRSWRAGGRRLGGRRSAQMAIRAARGGLCPRQAA